MNLSLRIARRYLFAKKSTNAINIITGISVFGIAVGTAALLLVLSVFNGFEDLISSMYSNFNPDVKIVPAQGKTFTADSVLLDKLYRVEGVALISQTLEETAFFEYKGSQDVGKVKGVDQFYMEVIRIDSTVREGRYNLQQDGVEQAVLGLGMRNKLQVNVDDLFSPMTVYMPKAREVGMFEPQFRRLSVYPVGTFVIQQEFNNEYVLTSLDFARALLDAADAVSALEIKLQADANQSQVVEEIRQIVGPDLSVKNRYEQEEAFLKLMQIEKWLSYAIVSLMMLLVSFNIVGALWMIVLDKQKDISILKSMGALDTTVRNIFLNEGLLLALLGIGIGFIIAILTYLVQKVFGIVSIPGNFIVEAYPISMRFIDFVVVAVTVAAIGVLASVPPALRAQRVPTIIREE
ncbi:MAG: FtsX-like permease family protein [Saprospiraceae bacterium]